MPRVANFSIRKIKGSEHTGTGRRCAWPNCRRHGTFRAPQHRDKLHSYHWLCLEHVRTYNKHWNYYEGMTEAEIENDRRQDVVWDRATWPFGADWKTHLSYPDISKRCFQNINEIPEGFEPKDARENLSQDMWELQQPATLTALKTLKLKPPFTAIDIKNSYKTLVKRFHPDTNSEDPAAEEKFKELTEAYEILKKLFTS